MSFNKKNDFEQQQKLIFNTNFDFTPLNIFFVKLIRFIKKTFGQPF